MKRLTTLAVLGAFVFTGVYFLIGLPGIGRSHHHLGQEYTISEAHGRKDVKKDKLGKDKDRDIHQRGLEKSEERVERLDQLLTELKASEGEKKMEVVEELLTELVEAEKRRSRMMKRGMKMMRERGRKKDHPMMPEMKEHKETGEEEEDDEEDNQ